MLGEWLVSGRLPGLRAPAIRLWIRRVLVRAEEGQLEALCCGLCLRRHVLDSVRTAPYLRPCTSRPEHTQRKPGSQNHGSSPPPRHRTVDAAKDSKTAELPS